MCCGVSTLFQIPLAASMASDDTTVLQADRVEAGASQVQSYLTEKPQRLIAHSDSHIVAKLKELKVVPKLQGPLLLSHISPNHRVGLLALTAAPALQEQYQQLIPLQRHTLYSATLLQHAALLLLLLVSDSLVLLIHTPAVPPAVLQLLHVLPKVKQQLLQQVHVLQKRSKTAAARGASEPQQHVAHVAATGCDDATAAAEAAAAEEAPLSNEQQGSQQFDQLLQLLHKPPSQLHVVMQVSAANEAQAAVKQAEHTLIRCKAISAAADSSNKSSSMSRRPTSGNKSSSSSSGLLFELSGVHACADEECRTQGLRRAVLNAIQQQLLPPNAVKQPQPPQQQQQPKEQHQSQQQLLTADKILADVAAAAAAGSSQSMSATVFKPEELQQVWQQLLALLFPTVHNSHGSSNSARYYPLYGMKPLQLDGTSTDDVILNSDDDADWDEVDDSWQEVRHAESSADGAESAAAAGDMLAAAVDPLYHMSLKRCSTAARAAFRAYLQAVPDRYPLSVHQHALKSALAMYQSTAAGPAAADVRDALCCCCLTAWQSGRQQCSALSLTARPCGNTPHNVQQEPHTSGVTFTLAAPDGTEQQQQHQDWFSFTAANVQPAQTLLQQQQQQQQQQETSMHSSRLLQTVVHLLNDSDSSGTTAQAGSKSKQQQQQQQQLILGPWLSLWSVPTHEFGSGSTAAAAATDGGSTIELSFITLPGQRWLPGLARLLPIRVWAPGGTRVATGSCAAAAAGVIGGSAAETSPDDGDDDEDRTVADSATDGKDILKGILEGLHVKGSKAAAAAGGKRGKGERRGGKSAAAAAAGSDGSWSQTAARPGRRGRGGGARQETPPAAAAAVVLGPEEFPTLAEATTGAKKSAADGRLQQGGDSATPGADTSSTPQKGKRAAAAAAAAARTAGNIVQQQLLEAWSQLGQQQQPQYAGSSSSSHPDAAVSYTAAVRAQQSVRGAAAAAAKRGRGRGQRGAAAVAVTSGGVSSAPGGGGDKVPDMVVLTQLWIGLEYESLAGQRCMLQPQHLLKSVQQQQQRSDTPVAAAAAATTAAVAAARNLPGSRGGGRSGARGGRGTQQQQQQHGSSTPPVSARPPPAVGDHQGASGVEQLLLQDVPLFIHMAAAGIHGSSKASPAAAAAPVSGVGSTCQTSQPVDVELLQLKRIHIRTPPSPFTFASHPRIRFTAAATAPATAPAAAALAATSLAATAPAAVGVATAPGSSSAQPAATQPVTGSSSSSSSSNSVLEFTSSEGVVLPADSQLVLNLPQVFGAPADWVREVCAAAADAVAAAGVVMDPATGTEHHVVAAASAEETAVNCGEPSAASAIAATAIDQCKSGTGTAATADADEGNTSSTDGLGQVLLPLLPIEIPQASLTTYPSATAAAAVAGAVSIGSLPPSSGGLWHAVLCAGSWLYPVAPELY